MTLCIHLKHSEMVFCPLFLCFSALEQNDFLLFCRIAVSNRKLVNMDKKKTKSLSTRVRLHEV